jgi:Zn-dependent peptidase ImmA (M78 family)/transcriptional regulator with XRE-family HTH domain
LREARREVGLSTRAVAGKLPRKLTVSHTTIASYENGVTVPPVDVLAALADLYVRPLNWFLESRETLSCFRYRNLSTRVRLAEQRRFEAITGKWVDAYFNLERHLKNNPACPSGAVPAHGPVPAHEDIPPDVLAATVRKNLLHLEDEQPIQNVVSVLESFSTWALELRASFGIDGAATRRGDEFIVVLNPDVTNDRVRMNAAHELAHVLYDGCKQHLGLTDDDVEKRAYVFASSLLLPESQLKSAFDGKSFLKLVQYKEKFGISLAAMIYMAEKTRTINTTASRWLWSEMARRGWRQSEPGYVWRDRAISFEIMLESAIQSRVLTWSDAERVTGIREAELRERIASVLRTGEPQAEPLGHEPLLKFAPKKQTGDDEKAGGGKHS